MSTEQSAAFNSAASALNQATATLDVVVVKVQALETKLGLAAPSVPKQHVVSKVAATDATVTKQERAPWVWVSGETKPHRQELRDAGGRWSPRRQAWYFIDCDELPSHLQNLPGTEVAVTY
jgi:hypothetical protein